jgi:hypothetical protein
MLIGCASVVTYRSDIAKLAMKIDSAFLCLDFVAITTKVNIFPNVPATLAISNMIIHGIASQGSVIIN